MGKLKRPVLWAAAGTAAMLAVTVSAAPVGMHRAVAAALPSPAAATPAWYGTGWAFRRPILVDNTKNSVTLAAYQVKIILPRTFSFAQTRSDGSDIRFTDSDGVTPLSYWIENYSPATQTGTIWVKIPAIPAGARKTIYIYYHNPYAAAASSGQATFGFFDSFSNPAWTSLPSMPVSKADATASVLNGKFYIIGGYGNTAADPLRSNYEFDPASNTYTARASMPTPRWGLISGTIGDLIHVFGGNNLSGATAANESYDPATDTWATHASLPAAIAHQGITGCTDGTAMYLFYNGLAYRYSPATDSYTRLASMPNLILSWASCAYSDGNIYLIGGYSSGARNYTQIYHVADNTWGTGAPMPFALYGAVREDPAVGSDIYIVQGQRAGSEFSAKAYVYHTVTGTWAEESFGPHAADGVAGGEYGGKIYTFGGRQDATGPYGLNYATAYDPARDGGSRWTQVTGNFEMSGGWLRKMVPARGTLAGNVAQIRSSGYRTYGSFVMEAQGDQASTGGSWNSIALHTNAGTYNRDLTGYQVQYNDYGVTPTATSIYRENGTVFTKLASYSPAVTGSQRFKVTSTSSAISLYRNGSLKLTTHDTSYRNGYLNVETGYNNRSKWRLIFTRQYAANEPWSNVGNEQAVDGSYDCPCSAWSPTAVPASSATSNTTAYELGTRFYATVSGSITALRFYKEPGMATTHTGDLWDSTGRLLATVTFTSESASGWQQARLTSPVAIRPNTAYIVSYVIRGGPFAFTQSQFAAQGVDDEPIHLYKNGAAGPDGTFHTGGRGFPTSGWSSTNYWSDVVFMPA